MKCLLDTNFLISTSLFPNDVAVQAYFKVTRDIKDCLILRVVIKSNAELLIIGEKDFIESGLKHPVILSPAEFLTTKDDKIYSSYQT